MILKFINGDRDWEYVECTNPAVVKMGEGCIDVVIKEKSKTIPINREAYLLNDRGQTIERLN